LPLFYQEVRGTTALTAGIVLVPQGIGSVLSRTVAGSNIDRFGSRRIVLAGCVIVAVATVAGAVIVVRSHWRARPPAAHRPRRPRVLRVLPGWTQNPANQDRPLRPVQ